MTLDSTRKASTLDASAIAELVNAAYRPTPGAGGWTHESEWVAGDRTTPENIAEIIAKPNSVILVGIKDSAIVACVHIETEDQISHIGLLTVKPKSQAAGIGKAMLALAEEHATIFHGAKKLHLNVISQRTELVSYYLRRGYRQTGMTDGYPVLSGVGAPINQELTIEVLEKQPNGRCKMNPTQEIVSMKATDKPIFIYAADAPLRAKPSVYPPMLAGRVKGCEKRPLGDVFGLTNYGVNLTRLSPGAASSLRHAHAKQDELVYILEGHPTLHTNEGRTQLSPGMCAGFKAGTGNAHSLINETVEDVLYLEIGDRSEGDEVIYPDDDLCAKFVNGAWAFFHKDGTAY